MTMYIFTSIFDQNIWINGNVWLKISEQLLVRRNQ